MDKGTNTPEIQKIIDLISPWSIGYKLLGAGGGGFMFIIANDEEAVAHIKQELAANPINDRARLVDFNVSNTGLQVTKS
jgi:mevalonate kinase